MGKILDASEFLSQQRVMFALDFHPEMSHVNGIEETTKEENQESQKFDVKQTMNADTVAE